MRLASPRRLSALAAAGVLILSCATARADAPSGDVLNPGHAAVLHWFVGLDGGPTFTTMGAIDSSGATAGLLYLFADPYQPQRGTRFVRDLGDHGTGWGFHVGGHVEVFFGDRFGAAFKVQYAQRRATFSNAVHVPCVRTGGVVDTAKVTDDFTARFGVVSLALSAEAMIVGGWYGRVGIGIGFPVSQSYALAEKIVSDTAGKQADCYYLDDNGNQVSQTLNTTSDSLGALRTQIDLLFATGYRFAVGGRWFVVPEVTAGLSLARILDAGQIGLKTPWVFYPSIGITYQLN